VILVGVDDSSNYWLGSVEVNAPLLDLGSPGFEPRSGLSFSSYNSGLAHAAQIESTRGHRLFG
jgi:hypothetical protein